ncbi:hypothetical protein DPMN_030255 [Dreissena polymorpha]|uniref:Uncharacterized protein n=1 Tax=Dreissena polymorpha TaxID=45954 RepID=A0A9D4LZL3_DREPO|nr:hypothetical protein DPMN_030255 [Dreissena polymorpha]
MKFRRQQRNSETLKRNAHVYELTKSHDTKDLYETQKEKPNTGWFFWESLPKNNSRRQRASRSSENVAEILEVIQETPQKSVRTVLGDINSKALDDFVLL